MDNFKNRKHFIVILPNTFYFHASFKGERGTRERRITARTTCIVTSPRFAFLLATLTALFFLRLHSILIAIVNLLKFLRMRVGWTRGEREGRGERTQILKPLFDRVFRKHQNTILHRVPRLDKSLRATFRCIAADVSNVNNT